MTRPLTCVPPSPPSQFARWQQGALLLAGLVSTGCPSNGGSGKVTGAEASSAPVEPPSPVKEQLGIQEAPARTCGGHRCWSFASSALALRALLLRERPSLLGVGEAHPQKGGRGRSPTELFMTELLPELAQAGARALVVELLAPAPRCQEATQRVARVQRPVLKRQKADNQHRFVELGHAARKRKVTPFLLEPPCERYRWISADPQLGIDRLLTVIAEESAARLGRIRERLPNALLLSYGGALHNDLVLSPDRQAWSYGPVLNGTERRYVALDLVVPEVIGHDALWKRQRWYEGYQQVAPQDAVWLMEVSEHSYALFFRPRGAAIGAAGGLASASASPSARAQPGNSRAEQDERR